MAYISVEERGVGKQPDVLCAKCMAKGEHPLARAGVTAQPFTLTLDPEP